MKNFFLILIFTTTFGYSQTHSFKIENGNFVYDNNPIKIYSGELHYARIPKEYWKHRLQMVKAMGLNAVCTYVFWNYHETTPGVWDFKSENKDLAAFIQAAQDEGLFVILRPGPYACAEWEFGGYPWWLQNNPELVIRANNKPFLDSCRVYINKLAEEVCHLQITKGGPVIMVQVENEFGSYVNQRKDIPLEEHKKYSAAIHQMLIDAGFEVPFFTSDASGLFEGGSIPGALITANGEDDVNRLKKSVNQYHGQGPYMVAEFYPGWFDTWTEPFVKVSTDKIVKQTEIYLKSDVNFNFYMVHGGTNFGFTSGANSTAKHEYQPDITSYDYDAPISEAGWPTKKYHALRGLMKKYVSYEVPEVPAAIPVINLDNITLTSASFFTWKNSISPVLNDTPLTFEQLNQGHGYVLYSKKILNPVKGKLSIEGVRDYATVYVNQKKVGVLDRVKNIFTVQVDIPANAQLDILVENMGRINYGANIIHNQKGILSPVLINNVSIVGNWEMYKIPMNEQPVIEAKSMTTKGIPTLYQGEFELDKIGDVFFDMRKWNKGIVFVNGHNLGRYWNAGPQQTLYLPGCWLKKGRNEVVIFEQLNDQIQQTLRTTLKPELNSVR